MARTTSNGSPVTHHTTATLHDGSTIPVEVTGTGPAVVLPANPVPATGPQADELRAWGLDPALGRTLVDALSPTFCVVASDDEGHRMAHPAPDTLTPENVAADLRAIADAAGAETFAYYGYSWLALSGLQLALRTTRLSALVMGGFPPRGGPYAGMLAVTRATHARTSEAPAEPTDGPTAQREASDVVGQEERAQATGGADRGALPAPRVRARRERSCGPWIGRSRGHSSRLEVGRPVSRP
ncbi:alpha/beta fold hydrolase [Oerskovia turbata]|uniref:alpha/beta fold hydrolase n=1 Tax=Oerskovia turbata TaxID=1713 RepID=UPI000AD6D22D|nr:alpha/beta hydrolase [Oerskovia turbata]